MAKQIGAPVGNRNGAANQDAKYNIIGDSKIVEDKAMLRFHRDMPIMLTPESEAAHEAACGFSHVGEHLRVLPTGDAVFIDDEYDPDFDPDNC